MLLRLSASENDCSQLDGVERLHAMVACWTVLYVIFPWKMDFVLPMLPMPQLFVQFQATFKRAHAE